jgi:hypothetical protein
MQNQLPGLVAQLAIAEIAAEYNLLTEYRAGLHLRPWQPWLGADDAQAEAAQAAYKDAAAIVARQFGIKLEWKAS